MAEISKLRAGDWVEVLSKEEILATLDANGRLEQLPFMPEMFQYCGKRFQVFKRAHKTCDPPNGMAGRRMRAAVHLDGVRCDGAGHGGCQAACLIFWKEAWLKRVDNKSQHGHSGNGIQTESGKRPRSTPCNEQAVIAATQSAGDRTNSESPTYICQSTHLSGATQPLRWWDLRQYLEDLSSGNVSIGRMLATFLFFLYYNLAEAGLGLGSAMRWAYDRFQQLRGGTPYPWRKGRVPEGVRTPSGTLNLQPGEVVKVKPFAEILATLDQTSKTRGMYFDGEMVPFCDGTFPVLKRVEKIIDEKTGKMLKFKTDAIILGGVACKAQYSDCRRFCPRSIYPYWREVWLERVSGAASDAAALK